MKKYFLSFFASILFILSGIFLALGALSAIDNPVKTKTQNKANLTDDFEVNKSLSLEYSIGDFMIREKSNSEQLTYRYKPQDNLTVLYSQPNEETKIFTSETSVITPEVTENVASVSNLTYYKFESLGQQPDLNSGSIMGTNINGYIYGQTSTLDGTQIPTIWDSNGNIVRRLDDHCNRMGSVTDMNSSNTIIGTCFDETDEYLQSFVYDLDDDTYTILPGKYDSKNVQAVSINNNNQIVGTMYTPDTEIQQRPIYWEKDKNGYIISDLTDLIYQPNTNGTPFNATHIFAVKLFNDGNLLLNAYDQESGWHFVGYYQFEPENEIG